MAKPGRNDRCPCGSGKKYKACCLTADETAEREALARAQAARQEQATRHRASLDAIEADVLAHLQMAEAEDALDDALDEASNAVVGLVKAGKLDDAEAAARSLLASYPEVHDGWDRLGMVHEARGNGREAAACYRKVLEFVRANPDDIDPEFERIYADLVAKLDPEPVV